MPRPDWSCPGGLSRRDSGREVLLVKGIGGIHSGYPTSFRTRQKLRCEYAAKYCIGERLPVSWHTAQDPNGNKALEPDAASGRSLKFVMKVAATLQILIGAVSEPRSMRVLLVRGRALRSLTCVTRLAQRNFVSRWFCSEAEPEGHATRLRSALRGNTCAKTASPSCVVRRRHPAVL